MAYFYIIDNKDWNYESKYKYGYTKNPINRICNSSEQHSYQSQYKQLYKIEQTEDYIINYTEYDKIISIIGRDDNIIDNIENYYNITLTYLRNIKTHLVNNSGSTEFIYTSGIEVLHNLLMIEFPLLGLNTSIVDVTEIQKINKEVKQKTIIKTFNPFTHKRVNILRVYQKEIISGCVDNLIKTNKVYLELSTGGGKSFIVYNIFNIIQPKTIFIFVPLNVIKSQNISKKYTDILTTKYKILMDIPTKPIKNSIANNIIVCCTQSYKKVYDYIIANDLKDVCIWYDEAHWAFEEWTNCIDDNVKQFLLRDTEYITKRIFTSASPDKEIVLKNKNIFGELYNPIKACELIKDKWLCNINPYVFSVNKNDPDIIYYNLEGFKEKNKKFGFSFHSNCNNAYSLFMKHYKLYKEAKTNIRPFLLLGDNFKQSDDIELEYDYTDVKIFETTPESIGYVVKRFSIGYDFDKIDILFISDPKTSYKDIIQTIGRGMRPDKLGVNGKNLNKILDIYLPIYFEEDGINDYSDIVEVMRYLIHDIGLEYKEFVFKNVKTKKHYDITDKNNEDKYIGSEDVEGVLLELLKNCNKKRWNCKKITEHLCKNNIHNHKDYNEYYKNNPELEIPENIFIEYPDFIWYDTYRKDECPYYTKKECIEVIKNLSRTLSNYERDNEKMKFLTKYDVKIPCNYSLWRFYGGLRNDYFID